jgi:hypothetical protein
MTQQNKDQADPDLARRIAGMSPKPAGPEPPGTGYASHPDAGTGAAEGPETERGGSPAPNVTSRLNEPEERQ